LGETFYWNTIKKATNNILANGNRIYLFAVTSEN
jgi:hypothetical protein